MAQAEETTSASGRLLELVGCLRQHQGFDEVLAGLHTGKAITLDGVWGSSRALCVAALAEDAPGPLVVVSAHTDDVDDLVDDLGLFSRVTPEKFAALESLPGDRVIVDDVFGDRVRVVKRLFSGRPPEIVATSIQALMQPVPDRDTLAEQSRTLAVEDQTAIEDLSRWLVENGFHSTSSVELPGEFSIRGGLVDIFAYDWFDPVRVEFFGDCVESIRRFEVASQRSLTKLESIELTVLDPQVTHSGIITDYLPDDAWVVMAEPEEIHKQGAHYLERVQRPQDLHGVDRVMRGLLRYPTATTAPLRAEVSMLTMPWPPRPATRYS